MALRETLREPGLQPSSAPALLLLVSPAREQTMAQVCGSSPSVEPLGELSAPNIGFPPSSVTAGIWGVTQQVEGLPV